MSLINKQFNSTFMDGMVSIDLKSNINNNLIIFFTIYGISLPGVG